MQKCSEGDSARGLLFMKCSQQSGANFVRDVPSGVPWEENEGFFPLPTILFSSPTVPWALATFCCSKDPLLLASISSFKSITLSEPHHHNEANMWKKKGENLQSRRKQQRRITSNQMSKNEIGWELRHFADGCLQEGTLKRQKKGGILLATDQSLCQTGFFSTILFLRTFLFARFF